MYWLYRAHYDQLVPLFKLQPVSCLGASLPQHQGNPVKALDMRLICSLMGELGRRRDAAAGHRLLL